MREQLDCEVLVVGSGPGGSVTAYALARAGFDVLLAEEGPDVRTASCAPYSSAEMDLKYRNAGLTPCFGSARVVYAEGRCLGGGSEINSGFFHRISDIVLDEWQKSNGLFDLNCGQIERFYREIEQRLAISTVGEGEGASSVKMKQGSEALNWTSEEIPRWISSRRSADGEWISKRAGMSNTYIADAIAVGCRVETGLMIDRLSFDRGRWKTADARRLNGYITARNVRIHFKWVFICCGATGTVALLRRSGLKRNIGNSLQLHPMVRVVARFEDEVNEGSFGVPVRQVTHFRPNLTLGCSVSTPAHLALWMAGQDRETKMAELAPYFSVFYALVRSKTFGRIRTIPSLPEPLVFWNLTSEDYEAIADGLRKLAMLLFAAGAREIFLPVSRLPPIATISELDTLMEKFASLKPEVTTIHLFGGCPLGADAKRFPLDSFGKIHGTANLFVNDVSMLPGTTGVNPQATVMAIAMRNIQHFLSTTVPA